MWNSRLGATRLYFTRPVGDSDRKYGSWSDSSFFDFRAFLQIRFALWVLVGLPFAFLGAFMCLPLVGITINMMSLFAFILVLGIVVDDAIIIAESSYGD